MRALPLVAVLVLLSLPSIMLAVLSHPAAMIATPAVAGMLLVVLLFYVQVCRRDVQALTKAAQRLGSDDAGFDVPVAARLSVLDPLAEEIDRAARRVSRHTASSEDIRRTEHAILERLPDPLIVLASDHTVLRTNPAARAAFGTEIPALQRHPTLRAAIDRALTDGTTQHTELTLPVPIQRALQAAVVPIQPPLADGGRAMLVVSDRTRERALERTRADFVANASHELRTPLASLVGFVETLRGPAADDPPAQQRFLAIMAEQAARMSRLIDDLLSLSRVELMEHQPPSTPLDLALLLPRVAAGFEPRLKQRTMALDLHIAEALPLAVGDADQVAQVLQNLLDNATKYGREGGTVRLEVDVAPLGGPWPARAGVTMTVIDQGPGIAQEDIPRLTERFYRVDKGRSRAVGGTGLGLAIVKHILNRHRGQMIIESELGVGTTIRVWLPQAV